MNPSSGRAPGGTVPVVHGQVSLLDPVDGGVQ